MSKVKRMSLDSGVVNNDLIMGIDLGTTNSAVAVYTRGVVPALCPMGPNGKTTLQSCVRWDGGDKFTVGPEAYADRYKPNVCYSVKRLMGTDSVVQFKLDGNEAGMNSFLELTPAEVSAEILKALAARANEYYPGLYRCIITVPAYFNQRQIEDTIKASKLAGLECVQILKEPTSASYIYSELGYAQDGSILIYDLGGGTFDVTIMSFLRKASIPTKVVSALKRLYKIDVNSASDDSSSLYYCRVLGTYGDTKLGGDDIDDEIALRVWEAAGKPKVSLAAREELILRCEQFKKGKAAAQDLEVQGQIYHVTREDVKEATRVIFNRTLDILNSVSQEQLDQVKTIVLVGGSTKSEYIVEFLEDTFPGMEISRVLDPDATVALGAGAVAKDLQEGRGASYQDVLPLAIGILDNETTIDVCIPKNTAMPYSVSRVYHTIYDNQEAVSIDVYQGLSKNPDECVYLGKLRIDKLPPKPAGTLDITVSFLLSAQGRLKVTSCVEGISEMRELTIDSIFSVNNEEPDVCQSGEKFDRDDFEKTFAEFCSDNPRIAELLLKRRELLAAGSTEVDAIESEILEEI